MEPEFIQILDTVLKHTPPVVSGIVLLVVIVWRIVTGIKRKQEEKEDKDIVSVVHLLCDEMQKERKLWYDLMTGYSDSVKQLCDKISRMDERIKSQEDICKIKKHVGD